MQTKVVDAKPTSLHLWGRVVDEQLAKHMPRELSVSVPVQINDPTFPENYETCVYLDGSHYINPRRADCCLGWFVEAQKKQQVGVPTVGSMGITICIIIDIIIYIHIYTRSWQTHF